MVADFAEVSQQTVARTETGTHMSAATGAVCSRSSCASRSPTSSLRLNLVRITSATRSGVPANAALTEGPHRDQIITIQAEAALLPCGSHPEPEGQQHRSSEPLLLTIQAPEDPTDSV